MTNYLIASAPRHIGWLGLLLVVTTMFVNAEAAMPPQLAIANVSVIDPITNEVNIYDQVCYLFGAASAFYPLIYILSCMTCP